MESHQRLHIETTAPPSTNKLPVTEKPLLLSQNKDGKSLDEIGRKRKTTIQIGFIQGVLIACALFEDLIHTRYHQILCPFIRGSKSIDVFHKADRFIGPTYEKEGPSKFRVKGKGIILHPTAPVIEHIRSKNIHKKVRQGLTRSPGKDIFQHSLVLDERFGTVAGNLLVKEFLHGATLG